MNNPKDKPTSQAQRPFAELATEQMPPSSLEERVVDRLRAANIIRVRTSWLPSYPVLGLALALSLLTFVTGAILGARQRAVTPKKSDLPEFILVLRLSSSQLEAKSPQEERERVKEYGAWARDLKRQGLLFGGEKLKDESRFLNKVHDSVAVNETHSKASQGDIGGYFLIPARDYDQAISIANTCPHLKHGGTVEVRQIERF